jgi:hypothetical protein
LPCSLGLSATSEQYFSLRTNQPPAISQQYFSLKTNQHQPSATSKTNRLCVLLIRATLIELDANVNAYRPGMNIFSSCTVLVELSTEILCHITAVEVKAYSRKSLILEKMWA